MSENIVYLVNEVSDPYEPSNTSAICTSIEEVMKLGLENLWDWSENEKGDYECKNLITGETKLVSRYGFPPSPYLSTMELNKYFPMNPEKEEDCDD